MYNNSIHLKKNRMGWWFAWMAGAIAEIIYNIFSMHWYHFYVYFYVVGIVVLADSLIGWGEITADGIKIRLGLSGKRKLYFEWRDILEVKITNINKTLSITSGGRDKIPFSATVYIRALVLRFKNDLSNEAKTRIKAIKRSSIFKERVNIDEKKNQLVVFEKPEGGFEEIVNALNGFRNVELKLYVDKDHKDSVTLSISRNFLYLIDLFVIIFTFSTIFYYGKKWVGL